MLMLLHFILLLPSVFAGTTLHYFKDQSCDTNGIGDFNDTISAGDTSCHISPRNITLAIYIDTIDDDCAGAGGLLRSWKNVCGDDLTSASASFNSFEATATHITASTVATSLSLSTETITSTWQSGTGTAAATYTSTMTQTLAIPVQVTQKDGAQHLVANVVGGGIVAVLVLVGGLFMSL